MIRTDAGVEVVDVTPSNIDQILVHDAHATEPTTAFALSRLTDFGYLKQAPIGIFRSVERPTYDDGARQQVSQAMEGMTTTTEGRTTALSELLHGGDTWTIG